MTRVRFIVMNETKEKGFNKFFPVFFKHVYWFFSTPTPPTSPAELHWPLIGQNPSFLTVYVSSLATLDLLTLP